MVGTALKTVGSGNRLGIKTSVFRVNMECEPGRYSGTLGKRYDGKPLGIVFSALRLAQQARAVIPARRDLTNPDHGE